MSYNDTLRQERENRGWSPQDLAIKLGTSSQTITRWENGTGPHTLHMLEVWAEVLGHRLTTELMP